MTTRDRGLITAPALSCAYCPCTPAAEPFSHWLQLRFQSSKPGAELVVTL